MIAGVTERAGHSAAAGIEIDDARPGDVGQQRLRRSYEPHRFLVTVAVEQDRPGSGLQGKSCHARRNELLEEHTDRGDLFRSTTALATKERRRILAHGREAARLAEHDRPTCDGIGVQRLGVSLGHLACRCAAGPCEICGRPQQRFGASAVRTPGPLKYSQRGKADLRVVVVRERVVEQERVNVAGGGRRKRSKRLFA